MLAIGAAVAFGLALLLNLLDQTLGDRITTTTLLYLGLLLLALHLAGVGSNVRTRNWSRSRR